MERAFDAFEWQNDARLFQPGNQANFSPLGFRWVYRSIFHSFFLSCFPLRAATARCPPFRVFCSFAFLPGQSKLSTRSRSSDPIPRPRRDTNINSSSKGVYG